MTHSLTPNDREFWRYKSCAETMKHVGEFAGQPWAEEVIRECFEQAMAAEADFKKTSQVGARAAKGFDRWDLECPVTQMMHTIPQFCNQPYAGDIIRDLAHSMPVRVLKATRDFAHCPYATEVVGMAIRNASNRSQRHQLSKLDTHIHPDTVPANTRQALRDLHAAGQPLEPLYEALERCAYAYPNLVKLAMDDTPDGAAILAAQPPRSVGGLVKSWLDRSHRNPPVIEGCGVNHRQ